MRDGLGRRWTAGLSLFIVIGTTLLPAVSLRADGADDKRVAPVVPGYYARQAAKAEPAELGEILLGELNCTKCHTAQTSDQRILSKDAPDLSTAGSRLTPQWIREYVGNPHASKPGNTMPDIFHSSDPDSKKGAVEYLTHFLVSQGGPMKPDAAAATQLVTNQGRELFETVGCVACHAPEKAVNAKVPSVPFGNLAKKYTTQNLAAFLLDPHKVRPGGRMPYLNLTTAEAQQLAVYLLRDQINNPQSKNSGPARKAGLEYIFYEVNAHTAAVEMIDPLKPKLKGEIANFNAVIPGQRNQNYAIKFSGIIEIPRDGKYTFFTASDDGSHLYIDGKKIVDNDGVHPKGEKAGDVELKKGDHTIVLTYFQGGGEAELEVSWQGPELAKQAIPAGVLFSMGGQRMVPLETEEFTVDPQKAQVGKQMFSAMGCAACHIVGDLKPMKEYKPLAMLNTAAATGCLADQPARGIPLYELSADQKDAIKAALKNVADFAKALEPKDLVVRTMAAMNCYACHVRDRVGAQFVGGPDTARQPFFTMTGKFDMGGEGFLPPKLTSVGSKLLPEAMKQIIFEGKLHIRTVMATRMPRFSAERIGFVVDAFQKSDDPKGTTDEPKFTEAGARAGRQLVGVKNGLGCVNCHGVAGNKSLGMPGPDLVATHDRLKVAWFRELLHDPAKKNPATRMPALWFQDVVTYKDVADGTPAGQIDAIWQYVSLGKSMPLPSGIEVKAGEYVLAPGGEPLIHRTFMKDVGNRSILVGYPESMNIAFDADTVRLAKAWRGKFFDASGMWKDRGGNHLGALGADIIDLPTGPAFAFLTDANAEWPKIEGDKRNVGGKYHGYRLDKMGQPIFHYVLNNADIEEAPTPELKPGGSQLTRKFTVKPSSSVSGLYFLAATGKKIEPKGDDHWIIDDKVTIGLPKGMKATVRDGAGGKQLVVPIEFKGDAPVNFDVEMAW